MLWTSIMISEILISSIEELYSAILEAGNQEYKIISIENVVLSGKKLIRLKIKLKSLSIGSKLKNLLFSVPSLDNLKKDKMILSSSEFQVFHTENIIIEVSRLNFTRLSMNHAPLKISLQEMQEETSKEIGFTLPSFHIRLEETLSGLNYKIKINGKVEFDSSNERMGEFAYNLVKDTKKVLYSNVHKFFTRETMSQILAYIVNNESELSRVVKTLDEEILYQVFKKNLEKEHSITNYHELINLVIYHVKKEKIYI
jgi:hypothetical protein